MVVVAMGIGLIARSMKANHIQHSAPFTAPEEPRSYSSPLQ
jgi:hypothetical protein